MDFKAVKMLGEYRSRASEYLGNKGKVYKLMGDAVKKVRQEESRLGDAVDNLHLVLSLVEDWVKGRYRQLPKRTLLGLLGGLIYYVIPTDAIPDIVLGIGLIDDAAVLAYIIRQMGRDLEAYKSWKQQISQEEAV